MFCLLSRRECPQYQVFPFCLICELFVLLPSTNVYETSDTLSFRLGYPDSVLYQVPYPDPFRRHPSTVDLVLHQLLVIRRCSFRPLFHEILLLGRIRFRDTSLSSPSLTPWVPSGRPDGVPSSAPRPTSSTTTPDSSTSDETIITTTITVIESKFRTRSRSRAKYDLFIDYSLPKSVLDTLQRYL